jgi:hypothetical protein
MPPCDGSEREGTVLLWCSWSKLTSRADSSGVRRMWDDCASESREEPCSGAERWGVVGGTWSL